MARTLRGRAGGLMILTAMMIASIAGTAWAGTSDLSPEMRAMVQRLAQRDPIQSCAADTPVSTMPSPVMFVPGGAAALSGPSPMSVGGANGLWVQCSLAYANGKPGGDCEGKHTINWTIANGGTNPKVTAELLAIDTQGNVLKSFNVKQGDSTQLNSRLSPSDWKFQFAGGVYQIFAPVGMLHVKVTTTTGDTADAYCTGIPYVDVIQPSGGVVTDNSGGGIDFKAAVPRTDLSQLQLKVDGVNILPLIQTDQGGGPGSLGVTKCTFMSPCNGTVPTTPVLTYSNLIIDVGGAPGTMSANVIQGTLTGLDCGGHYVRVIGAPEPSFRRTSAACNLDDLNDRGLASIFAIKLESLGGVSGAGLTPGFTTTQIPTEVVGEICSGTPIVAGNVNGLDLDVKTGQSHTPASGDVGDLYTVNIDESLPQTDLKTDFEQNATGLGTFAPGSNRLLIAATEQMGTSAYETLVFGVGDNIKPLGIDPSALISNSVVEDQTSAVVKQMLQEKLQAALAVPETTVKNAFIVGLSAEGAQTIMNNLCNGPIPGDGRTLGQIFHDAVTNELSQWTADNPLTTFEFTPLCSCDATVPVFVDSFEVGDAFSCPIVFHNGSLDVTLGPPDVTVTVGAHKHQGCDFPADHTNVDAFIKVGLTDITFTYSITEANIKNETTTVGAKPFNIGGQAQLDFDSDIDYGFLSDVCDFFVDGFVTLFTFGTVDIHPLLEPDFSISNTVNLTEALTPAQPGAIPITGFKVDQQVNNVYHQKLSGEISAVSDIHITGPDGEGKGAGITVGLKGTFATTSIDPAVVAEGIPGYQAVEPALPTMRSLQDQGGKDALLGLSVDAINTMFQSLGSNGDMKVPNADEQGCFSLGVTVGSLLPADCETIDIDTSTTGPGGGIDDIGNAPLRGWCHAIKGDNCQTLVFSGNPDVNLSSGERGVCWGAQGLPAGKSCWDVSTDPNTHITDLVEYLACSPQQPLGLNKDQNVMFCAKADIPIMKFPVENSSPTSVPTDLQINDISVSLVLDRGHEGGGGGPDNAVSGDLATLPGCFTGTQTTTDCNVFAACLDVDMKFAMNTLNPGNNVCENGKPGFQAQFTQILPPNFRKIGTVCSGPPATPPQNALDNASNENAVTKPIGDNAAVFAPPICGTGLVTPLFTCDNAAILGIDATVDPDFKEFLAVTCKIGAPPAP